MTTTAILFTPGRYADLIAAGVLTAADRCELLDGVIVRKRPPNVGEPFHISAERIADAVEAGLLSEDEADALSGPTEDDMARKPPHDAALFLLTRILDRRLPPEWATRVQSGLTMGFSTPEPDLIVCADAVAASFDAHPSAADAVLVVEVSDSTYAYDTGRKLAAYAAGGVSVYWVVDVNAGRVEVYSGPTAAGYASGVGYGPGEVVPLVIDGVELAVPVDAIFPEGQ